MITRREFISGTAAAAGVSLLPRLALAAIPREQRFVVIVLRGGMDGLDVVQPYGDAAFAGLRPGLARTPGNGLIDLDGRFGLHDGLARLAPLFRRGELAFVHAVATPYRRRSHFDAQITLETGMGGPHALSGDGWLNRTLDLFAGADPRYAAYIGTSNGLILSGRNRVTNWAPRTSLKVAGGNEGLLRELYGEDPVFRDALNQAVAAAALDADLFLDRPRRDVRGYAEVAGRFLLGRARLAAFSIGGWDTHRKQAGRIRKPLDDLAEAILALRSILGDHWRRTTVVAVSEFGRTAHQNGTEGTDHGTGGLMVFAGGTLVGGKGGRVVTTRWPGLSDGALREGRDLMPTDDVRRYIAWTMAALFGIGAKSVAGTVFPGVELDGDTRLLG